MKKKTSFWPGIAAVLVCLFPCSFHYFNNAGEAYLKDILPMFVTFLMIAALITLLMWPIVKSLSKAALLSSIAMLFVTNGGLMIAIAVKVVGKHHPAWFFAAMILFLLGLAFLFRRKNIPTAEPGMILCITIGVLIVAQVAIAAPTLISKVTFQREKSSIDVDAVHFEGERPNVYFLMVDEYSGTENFLRYFDYDNAEFYTYLKGKGFTISDSTSNTESIWTSTIIPNLMNLEYVVTDEATEHEKRRYLADPVLISLFQKNGYQVNLISHQDFLSGRGCNVISPPQFPEKITKFILHNSIARYLPSVQAFFEKAMPGENRYRYVADLRELFDEMTRCTEYVNDGVPTLTISYVQCPHYPFLFDADGNYRDGGFNFKDQYIYLDQVRYVTKILRRTIDGILTADPNAVIVLQSDHGARYPGQMLMTYGAPDYDPAIETVYMQNALNCVYCPTGVPEIEGQSAINTWRLLLNRLYGTDFPMLEQPTGYICYGTSWKDNRELNLID